VTRGRRAPRHEEEDMAKNQSDIFICKLKKDDFWAYPSPFVAHGGGSEIKFRNLTEDAIEIDLEALPVHGQTLALPARGDNSVFVDGDAKPGFYPYGATALVPVAPRGGKKARTFRRVRVKGGSSPKIIIDT
jgi:hypothetical protein